MFSKEYKTEQNWIVIKEFQRIPVTVSGSCCESNKRILFLNISSDQPDPPASQPVVSQLSSQSLVLSWMGPSYDGGTAVLGYIVEVSRQEGLGRPGSWTVLSSQCKSTSYRVCSGLEPLGQYCFRVRAYNSAGISEPSRESECVKMATASEWYVVFMFDW